MVVLKPKQWEPLAAVPILAGLVWLLADTGAAWWLWALLPGCLLLGTGMSLLFWSGDERITQFMAAGGIAGMVGTLPAMIVAGFSEGLLAGLGSAASFLTAGGLAVAGLRVLGNAPQAERTLKMYAKVALDEALLAYFIGTAKIPSGEKAQRICAELLSAREVMKKQGWLKDHSQVTKAPPPVAASELSWSAASIYGRSYEVLRFPSGFAADPQIPGAGRWMSYHSNDRTAAWVLRHADGPRPWLVCVHGYRMGAPWMDFALFPPRWLHDRLGCNLIMPVLPLHGPRRHGWRSGDEYLDGDFMDLLHAESQALWDLRRTIGWVRTQDGGERVGVLGYSLGGYNTALLATADADLDFVVAGIPVADFAHTLWHHIPPAHREYYEAQGATEDIFREVLTPVSPLARKPLLPKDRCHLFGGIGDRLVFPDEVMKLAGHWGVPVQWFQGAHLTFRRERAVLEHIENAMEQAGWPTRGAAPVVAA